MKRKQYGLSSLPLQVTLITLVVIGLAALFFLPQLLKNTPPTSRVLATDPGCNLNKQLNCLAADDQRSITLTIGNNNFHSMEPIPVTVKLKNLSADQVMLDLQGKDMYMGLNQVMLKADSSQENLWVGEITLAVCTTGEMVWKTSVITQSSADKAQADFYFTAR